MKRAPILRLFQDELIVDNFAGGSGEDQNGRGTGPCGRCDATGFIEVKRKIVERKEEAHE